MEGEYMAYRGWYKNFWCDSSWQLALIIYCLQHDIQIVRNTKTFPYPWRKGVKYYKPDFIIQGKYVQVKGNMDYCSKKKLNNFPFPIQVLTKSKMNKYLDYVIKKYGKDFYRLLSN